MSPDEPENLRHMPILVDADAPTFRKMGLGWEWTVDGIRFSVDYLKRHGDELKGILVIESQRPGEADHIHKASHNFSSFSTRAQLARHLTARVNDVDWNTLIEQFCVGVMNRSEKGADPIKIGRRDDDCTVIEWVVESLIPKGALTWWYGARASCKSQTAAWLTACLETPGEPFLDLYTVPSRVAIMDYEDNDRRWESYIKTICAGMGVEPPEIVYRHCHVPLIREVNEVARILDGEGADFVIFDAFKGAGGAAGERMGFEEVAIAFCSAVKEILESINGTALVIDHISQASRMNTKLPADPGGAGAKLDQARAGYELRMEKTPGSPKGHIGIFDRKHKMLKPIGLLAQWSPGMLTFEVEDLLGSGTNMAMDSISAGDRLMWQLRSGRKTEEELGSKLGIAKASLTKLVLKGVAMDKLVRYPDDTVGLAPNAIYSSGDPVAEDAVV